MTPGIGSDLIGTGRVAAALGLGKDAVEKAVAEARDRRLDAPDIDQIAAEAQDH